MEPIDVDREVETLDAALAELELFQVRGQIYAQRLNNALSSEYVTRPEYMTPRVLDLRVTFADWEKFVMDSTVAISALPIHVSTVEALRTRFKELETFTIPILDDGAAPTILDDNSASDNDAAPVLPEDDGVLSVGGCVEGDWELTDDQASSAAAGLLGAVDVTEPSAVRRTEEQQLLPSAVRRRLAAELAAGQGVCSSLRRAADWWECVEPGQHAGSPTQEASQAEEGPQGGGFCQCGRTRATGGGRLRHFCCNHCNFGTHSRGCEARERRRRSSARG